MAKPAKQAQPIPGYKLLSKLGSGGMGSVYRAVQESMDREVAIKIMPLELARNPEFKERFFREARAAGRLNHPNIVQGIDAGEAGKYSWIAMELVDGQSVAELLTQKGRFSQEEALQIVIHIAKALEHASNAGIVHRDVKPENFLLTAEGVAKLCDLGIAKACSDDTGLTQDGRAVGTPRYISPEQARGEHDIDSRSDIYSLGASWYHMLTGLPPFDGPTAAVVMTKHLTDEFDPLSTHVPDIKPHTSKVLDKMMAKEPEKRYQDFKALLEDLEALERNQIPKHATPVPGKRPSRAGRKGTSTSHKSLAGKSTKRRGGRGASNAGRKKDKDGAPMGLAIGAGIVLLVVILIVIAARARQQQPSSSPRQVVDEVVQQQESRTQHSGLRAPQHSATSTDRGEKDGAQPSGSSAADREEAAAARAWKMLNKRAKREPESLRPDRLQEFIAEYPDTSYAKKAREELTEFDRKTEALLEEEARRDFNRLRSGGYTSTALRQRYEDFVNTYPTTRYAEKVRLWLKEMDLAEQEAASRLGRKSSLIIPVPKDNPTEALKALRHIATGQDQANAAEIAHHFDSEDPALRAAAIEAMNHIDLHKALQGALAGTKDKDAAVRRVAAKVLREFKEPESRTALETLAESDPDPDVQTAAKEALQWQEQ